MPEKCKLCGCSVHRTINTYARPTILGRSHATKHHCVAERFFGRSSNRRGTQRVPIFDQDPWGHENITEVFCYECHEELLHNPVLLKEDLNKLASIISIRELNEENKTESRQKIAGRIKLLHEIIHQGIESILEKKEERKWVIKEYVRYYGSGCQMPLSAEACGCSR